MTSNTTNSPKAAAVTALLASGFVADDATPLCAALYVDSFYADPGEDNQDGSEQADAALFALKQAGFLLDDAGGSHATLSRPKRHDRPAAGRVAVELEWNDDRTAGAWAFVTETDDTDEPPEPSHAALVPARDDARLPAVLDGTYEREAAANGQTQNEAAVSAAVVVLEAAGFRVLDADPDGRLWLLSPAGVVVTLGDDDEAP